MSESIKMRGRLLLFDVVDILGWKIPKDCELTYQPIIPIFYNFRYNDPESILGSATVEKDEKGLICTAVINRLIDRNMLCSAFNNELPMGGYFRKLKDHYENGTRVFDKLDLVGIGVTLSPAHEEYKLVLVEEENGDV